MLQAVGDNEYNESYYPSQHSKTSRKSQSKSKTKSKPTKDNYDTPPSKANLSKPNRSQPRTGKSISVDRANSSASKEATKSAPKKGGQRSKASPEKSYPSSHFGQLEQVQDFEDSLEDDDIDEDDDSDEYSDGYTLNDHSTGYTRRGHTLERNRIAATKCRLRKRSEASDLATRERTMEEHNRYLFSCFNSLSEEVYTLKSQLLQHTDCNCALIQKYIASEAIKSVDNLPDIPQCPSHPADTIEAKYASFQAEGSVPSTSFPEPNVENNPICWTNPFEQAAVTTLPPQPNQLLQDVSMSAWGLPMFSEDGLAPDQWLYASQRMPLEQAGGGGGNDGFHNMASQATHVSQDFWQ